MKIHDFGITGGLNVFGGYYILFVYLCVQCGKINQPSCLGKNLELI